MALLNQLGNLSSQKGLIHGFSSISDGNMSFLWGKEGEVLSNRSRFLGKLGARLEKCAVMSVLDSGEIKVIDTDTPVGIGKEEKIRADALVTGKKGLFLFLLIADCLPVILYDPTRGVLALAHCGRKSTGDKLLQKVIDLLKDEFGTDPGDLIAGIGPGIHVESYKLEDFPERHLDDWKDFISEGRDGSAAVDLVSYNKLQLAESGVKEENIEISPIDTATDVNFFSHYRSRRNGEPEGRFAAVVGIV